MSTMSNERIATLVAEVASGEQKREHLLNASNEFSEQVQADYFSNARRYLNSIVADLTMRAHPDLRELSLKNYLEA